MSAGRFPTVTKSRLGPQRLATGGPSTSIRSDPLAPERERLRPDPDLDARALEAPVSSRERSGSSPGSSWGSSSTIVTSTPTRARNSPSSQPLTPPPRTSIDFGRLRARGAPTR